jgi:hypothetical protein
LQGRRPPCRRPLNALKQAQSACAFKDAETPTIVTQLFGGFLPSMHDREVASAVAPIADSEQWPNWKYYVVVAFMMALTLIYLVPTLRAGLSGGDVALAQVHGFGEYEGISPLSALGRVNAQLATERGGWFPLASFTLPFWWIEPAPVAVRALQMLAVMIDLGLFVSLVARLSHSLRTALLAGIGTLLALQLRKPHDAILGETLQLPLLVALLLCALLAFLKYLRTGNRSWLGCAFVLEIAACCMNEVAYPLALLFSIIGSSTGRSRRIGALFLVVPALLLAITLIAHRGIPTSVMWLVHPDASHLARMLQQLFAAVPTSYRALGNLLRDGIPDGEADTSFGIFPSATITDLAFCFVASVAVYLSLSSDSRRSISERSRPLALMAALLWFLPALFEDPLVWVHGMPFGEAGTAVFIECFGFGLLIALAIQALLASRHRLGIALVPPTATLLILLVSYGNVRANERVVRVDQLSHETWRSIVEGGRAGLFSRLPPNATIVFDGRSPVPSNESSGFRSLRYLLYQVSGKRFHVSPLHDIMPGGIFCLHRHPLRSEAACPAESAVWILTPDGTGLVGGGLTLAHWAGTQAGTLRVDRAVAFRNAETETSRNSLTGLVLAGGRGLLHPLVTQASNGILAEVRRGCGSVDLERAFTPDSPRLDYADGFLAVKYFKPYTLSAATGLASDTSDKQTWRFGTRRATLLVHPDGCPGQILFFGYVYARQPTEMVVLTNKQAFHISASQAGSHVGLKLTNSRSVPIYVTFITKGPPIDDEIGPQFDRRQFPQAYMLLVNPLLVVVPNAPHV